MSLPFRPSIRREYEAALDLTLPMLPWDMRSGGVGGAAIAASGVPESYVIRKDRIAALTLRVLEEELVDLLAELEAIRDSSESFDFLFDQYDPATAYAVYLHSPVWPDEIAPTRDEEYRGAFKLQVELRTVDGSAFDLTWVEVEEVS